jgi:hypothetical protein
LRESPRHKGTGLFAKTFASEVKRGLIY